MLVELSLDQVVVLRNALGARSLQIDAQVEALDGRIADLVASGGSSSVLGRVRLQYAGLCFERDNVASLDHALRRAHWEAGYAQG